MSVNAEPVRSIDVARWVSRRAQPTQGLASALHAPNDAREPFDEIPDPQIFAGNRRESQFPLLVFGQRNERRGDLFLVNHHELIPSW
jgi:hypothetical protein